MYGNMMPNPTAGAAKAIVIFLALILIGTVVLVTVASGNFGPKAEAQAKQIESQTRLSEAEKSLALKFQEARYQQQLEQAEQDAALGLMLKEWSTRVLVIGLTLAVTLVTLIIAIGKSVQWVYHAREVKQTALVEQTALANEALRMRNIYAVFTQMNDRLEQMNDRLEQMNDRVKVMQKQIANLKLQAMAMQQQLERLQTPSGNGSDSGEKIIPFKSALA